MSGELTLPEAVLETLSREVRSPDTFVSLDRRMLTVRYDGGEAHGPFAYDTVTRRAMDAAVIVAFVRRDDGPHVFLRSSLRVPLALRGNGVPGVLWELPAGLIEPGESPAQAAARELEEELGYRVDAAHMLTLGTPTAPCPGVIGELHYFFYCDVTDAPHAPPQGDGSPLEEGARIVLVPVPGVLDMCRRGEVPDAKTELAVRRFAERGV